MGINSALNISKDVLDKLDKAQGAVDQLAKDSETVAANFDTISQKIKDIGNIKVDLTKVFNLDSLSSKLDSFVDALKTVAETSGKNIKKTLDDVAKATNTGVTNVQDSANPKNNEKLEKALGMYEKTLGQIRRKIEALRKIDPASEAGEKAAATIDTLKEKIASLGLEYDATRAKSKIDIASKIEPISKEAAEEKIAALKEAIAELNKPGASNDPLNVGRLKELNSELDATKKILRDINIKGSEERLNAIDGLLKDCGHNAAFASSMIKQAFGPIALSSFFNQLMSIRGEFEMAERSLSAITKDALMSRNILNELKEISVESPYTALDLTKHTKQLAAFRIENEKLTDTTKMLGDIAAGTGVDVSRLILAYGQVKSAEFLKGTELRQFSEAGVNMLGGLSERFSEIYGRAVSVGEVMEMISKRMVKFSDVEAVLSSMTELGGTFYNMQAQQADTIQGMVANLGDRVALSFNKIGETYEDLIKGIINLVEFLIDKADVLSRVLLPLLSGKFLSGLLGLGLNGVKGGLARALGMDVKDIVSIKTAWSLVKGEVTGVKSAFTMLVKATGGWTQLIGTGLSLIINIVAKATEYYREVNKMAKETRREINEATDEYNKLVAVAADVSEEDEKRLEAIRKLQQEYGNVLSIENLSLENAHELNNAAAEHIELIKQEYTEQAKLQALQKAQEKIKKGGKGRTDNLFLFNRNASGRELLGVPSEDIDYLRETIENSILEGTITSEKEALNTYVDGLIALVDGVPEATEKRLRDYIDETGHEFFKKAFRLRKTIDNAFSFEDETSRSLSLKAREYEAEIKKLSNISLTPEEKESIGDDPAKLKLELQKKIQTAYNELKKIIEEESMGDIGDEMKKKLIDILNSAYSSLDTSKLETLLLEAQAKVYGKFPKLKEQFTTGLYAKAEGDSMESYTKKLIKRREELEKIVNVWKTGSAAEKEELKPYWGNAEETQKQLDALKMYISLISKATAFNVDKSAQRERSSQMKDFLKSLKDAKDEMSALTDEEKKMYVESLKIKGANLGITIADDFEPTLETVNTLIDKYLPFLSKDEQLEIKLAWSKEDTQAFIEDTRNTISDLWDKLDTAKKFKGFGISMEGYDESAIMSEIEDLEAKLREANFEGAIKLANEIKEKRIAIARDEWEQIAEIMSKTQEKALSKTMQAYKTAHNDILKALSIENPYGTIKVEEKDKLINNRLAVMLKEVADAEWEAYKGTEMYIAAFGNLEGMEKEILESLKGYLEGIDTSKLNPSDAKAVAKALDAMNKALLETETYSSVWDMIKKGFEDVDRAAKMYREDIPELKGEYIRKEEDLAVAREEQAAAQERYNYALEEYNRIISDPKATDEQKKAAADRVDSTYNDKIIAQANVDAKSEEASNALGKYNDAVKEASTLSEKATSSLNALASEMGKMGSALSSVFSLVKNVASMFGSELPEGVSATFDAFSEGFSVVAQTINTVSSAIQAYDAIKNTMNRIKDLSLGPLAIVALAIAAIVAALQAYDKAQAVKIEAHRKNVENLNKAYDKLNKSLDDNVLTMEDLNDIYADSASNLRRQREEIEEAIAINNTRKQTDKVREESEALQEELEAIDNKMTELDKKRKELLGAPDFSETGKSWSSSFLSQFKEVGDGLTALEDSFDEFYNNLIAGQLTHKVFAESMKKLEKMTQEILADGVVTPEESLALKKYRETELALLNERGKALAEALGMSGDRSTEHSLSKSMSNITSAQATALEALMNSERYYSADSNMRLVNIERTLTTEGEGTILSQIKAQAMYLKSMSDIAKAVYNPIKGAIKVAMD